MGIVDSLKQSAVNKKAMLKRFGFIPYSILKMSRGPLSKKVFTLQHEYPERGTVSTGFGDVVTDKAKESLEVRKQKGLLGGVISKRAEGVALRQQREERNKALQDEGGKMFVPQYDGGAPVRMNATVMPAELVEFFIKYYSSPGQVYLDPFMGQGIQMQVAKMYGLDYYGYDISEEFFNYIKSTKDKIDDGATVIQTTLGDSRYPTEIPDDIGDFSFHSPPYWDIEYYGDEPEQLGRGTYEEFLESMSQVYKSWLPKFKPGAYHIANVNDFRRKGTYYSYHADTIQLFKDAGWELYDTWIIDGLVGGLPKGFAVSFNLKKIAPKVHEYALVFRKPE